MIIRNKCLTHRYTNKYTYIGDGFLHKESILRSENFARELKINMLLK